MLARSQAMPPPTPATAPWPRQPEPEPEAAPARNLSSDAETKPTHGKRRSQPARLNAAALVSPSRRASRHPPPTASLFLGLGGSLFPLLLVYLSWNP